MADPFDEMWENQNGSSDEIVDDIEIPDYDSMD